MHEETCGKTFESAAIVQARVLSRYASQNKKEAQGNSSSKLASILWTALLLILITHCIHIMISFLLNTCPLKRVLHYYKEKSSPDLKSPQEIMEILLTLPVA